MMVKYVKVAYVLIMSILVLSPTFLFCKFTLSLGINFMFFVWSLRTCNAVNELAAAIDSFKLRHTAAPLLR